MKWPKEELPFLPFSSPCQQWLIWNDYPSLSLSSPSSLSSVSSSVIVTSSDDGSSTIFQFPNTFFCCFYSGAAGFEYMLCYSRKINQYQKINYVNGNIETYFKSEVLYNHYSFNSSNTLLACTNNNGVVILNAETFQPTGDKFRTTGSPTTISFCPKETKENELIVGTERGAVYHLFIVSDQIKQCEPRTLDQDEILENPLKDDDDDYYDDIDNNNNRDREKSQDEIRAEIRREITEELKQQIKQELKEELRHELMIEIMERFREIKGEIERKEKENSSDGVALSEEY